MSNNVIVNGIVIFINCLEYFIVERVVKILVYCVIIVVFFIGNIFIGLIVFKVKFMRRIINYFIVNMVMFDFIFLIFVVLRIFI